MFYQEQVTPVLVHWQEFRLELHGGSHLRFKLWWTNLLRLFWKSLQSHCHSPTNLKVKGNLETSKNCVKLPSLSKVQNISSKETEKANLLLWRTANGILRIRQLSEVVIFSEYVHLSNLSLQDRKQDTEHTPETFTHICFCYLYKSTDMWDEQFYQHSAIPRYLIFYLF